MGASFGAESQGPDGMLTICGSTGTSTNVLHRIILMHAIHYDYLEYKGLVPS